ncbi:sensor histidine kinase [Dongshaea marina]|uniref:sensor histidine kinase n=1 Tax=Dongshaea marina TaxID=2047966 RepID=UPI000D3E3363|nr:ATP-binding protein [Dongshaea marina]
MSLCILLLIDWMVIRYLKKLSDWAFRVRLDDFCLPLDINRSHKGRRDALDILVMGIQKMQSRLSQTMEEKNRAEMEVREWNKKLEKLVEERTKELNDSLKSLKKTQKQLVENEKMAALGQLTAGVAHEINTPLGISVSANTLLSESIEELEEHIHSNNIKRSQLDKIINTSQEASKMLTLNLSRAAQLIQSFKRISVDESSEIECIFNVHNYLQDIMVSVSPLIKQYPEPIALHFECEQRINIHSCPGSLAQIITNLVSNSIQHGFNDVDWGGRSPEITIKATLSEHNELVLDYHDNGRGLNPSDAERVFEPFYTTARGQGSSGLGMSILYNQVTHKLKGRVELDLQCADGFHLILFIPSLKPCADPEPHPPEQRI